MSRILIAEDDPLIGSFLEKGPRANGFTTFLTVDSTLRVADGEEYWELFSTSYGPTKTAADALEEERREEFHRTWVEFFEERREGDEVVHHREYLLTLGTRR